LKGGAAGFGNVINDLDQPKAYKQQSINPNKRYQCVIVITQPDSFELPV
jgi:hypothetical protein